MIWKFEGGKQEMAPNGRKKTHDLYPYTKFFIQTLFIKNRKNLSESDQRSIHAWSNSKKKTYICHGSGYRFETLETALFKNEVSFTWTLKTKPIETNEVKPPLHFAFTFRVFHCGKKDPTFLDFSKKEKKSSLKSLGNSDETQSRKFIFFHKILEFFFKKTVQYFYMHMHMHI